MRKRLLVLSILLMALSLGSCGSVYVLRADTIEEATVCTIELKGQVNYPGIYQVEKGTLLFQLLETAGGLNSYADLSNVNLVSEINVDQTVDIPYVSEVQEPYQIYHLCKSSYCFVDLRGEVKRPGIYQVRLGTSLGELLITCGGLTTDTAETQIEKSYRIMDNELITINISNGTTASNLVNINTATLDELQTLESVGSSLAQKIIDYRNANGSFKDISQIMNVKGVGEEIYLKNKDKLTV